MLNWDDEIQLSRLEVEQARRLAVAPLDEAIAQADLLLAEVRRLDASPEREELVERILALREERLAIKFERLARLDRTLSLTGRVVRVPAGVLQVTYNRYLEYCQQVIGALLQPIGEGRASRRMLDLPVVRHGLDVLTGVLQRHATGRLVFRCAQHVRLPHAHPFYSRSIASRSRMLAPVGAPPLDC